MEESREIQSEFLSILASSVSGGITRDVRETGIFAFMVDEVTDASNEGTACFVLLDMTTKSSRHIKTL